MFYKHPDFYKQSSVKDKATGRKIGYYKLRGVNLNVTKEEIIEDEHLGVSSEDRVLLILRGEGQCKIDKHSQPIKAGDVVVIPADRDCTIYSALIEYWQVSPVKK